MSRRRILQSACVLAAGGLVTGGLAWAFLNTPESNALMLGLSGLLILLATGVAGSALLWAVTLATAKPRTGITSGLGKSVLGFLLFAALWWLTSLAGDWWSAHRGEADAMILLRVGTSRTQGVHRLVFIALWFVRWSIGLSILANLVAAGALLVRSRFALKLAIRPASLIVAGVGAVALNQGLWRLAYWRPAGLGPTSTQLAFVTAKLATLYVAASLVVAIALAWIAGAMLRAPARRLESSPNIGPPRA